MQGSGQMSQKVKVFGNNITVAQSKSVVTGAAASGLMEKLVYGTEIANDHIFHEFEARYGAVVAQWLLEKMPK